MAYSDKKLDEIMTVYRSLGYDAGAVALGISKETFRRGVRRWRQLHEESGADEVDDNTLRQIANRYTPAELRAIALGGGSLNTPEKGKPKYSFKGDTIRIGLLTDTHLGSTYTAPEKLYSAFDVFAEKGVDFIAHCGDVFEGLSNRAGHVYECTHIGYNAQLDHGREVFAQWTDTDIFMVDGNHDRWFTKAVGAHIVSELCDGQENLVFLGHDEGDIELTGTPATIRLWHGEDAGSYALSYRIQKIVESFTGGEKPHVLFAGHTHKATYVFDRHIHCVSAGSIQSQSKWMRGKRIAAHTGFWVVEMVVDKNGVVAFSPTWYPFYD